MDLEVLRKRMVQEQLIARGIKKSNVLDAFYKVPRHKFVPPELLESAYNDYPLPIGEGQTISQPYIVALMTESLDLKEEERVLEIGTGSGYQTAILAELSKEVYTIERLQGLAENSQRLILDLGYKNVKIKSGDGTLGWPEFSPFDKIIITAATIKVPEQSIEQLKEGGRIVVPLGGAFSQILTVLDKIDGHLESQGICGCMFVPLIGKYGTRYDCV